MTVSAFFSQWTRTSTAHTAPHAGQARGDGAGSKRERETDRRERKDLSLAARDFIHRVVSSWLDLSIARIGRHAHTHPSVVLPTLLHCIEKFTSKVYGSIVAQSLSPACTIHPRALRKAATPLTLLRVLTNPEGKDGCDPSTWTVRKG